MARPTVCMLAQQTEVYLNVTVYSPPFPWSGILQVTEDPPACPQVAKIL